MSSPSTSAGRTGNQTPHIAIAVYILAIVTIPVVLEIFTNPLTTFGDAGTLAAFGFLTAYFLITFAAPVYLKKLGELRPADLVVAAAAVLLMVPLSGASTRCRRSPSTSSRTSSWPGRLGRDGCSP